MRSERKLGEGNEGEVCAVRGHMRRVSRESKGYEGWKSRSETKCEWEGRDCEGK